MATQFLLFLLTVFSPASDCESRESHDSCSKCQRGDKATAEKLLTNPNKPPTIVSSSKIEVSSDFDWAAQKEVFRNIEALAADVDQCWPELSSALDNDNYCFTFKHDMSIRNYSVGDICRIILGDCLRKPLAGHLRTEAEFERAGIPDVRRPMEFREWCREQADRDKELWELQAELCARAIDAIKTEAIPLDSAIKRKEALQGISEARRQIESSQKALTPGSIIEPDLRMRVLERDARRRF